MAKKRGKKEHKQQYKEAQKTFQAELKESHWLYMNNILCTSLKEGNSKPFYKDVRRKREDQVGVSPLKEDGVLHTSPAKINEVIAKQFRLVFANNKDDPFSETHIQGPSYPPIGELVIRDEGVEKLLAGMDPNNAAGPDEIPCRVLKELAHELAPVLCCLFHQYPSIGELPPTWLKAWIIPVFKKGPRCESENY